MRIYTCNACGLSFDAKPHGPMPQFCTQCAKANQPRRVRSSYNTVGGKGIRYDQEVPGVVLAAITANHRASMTVAIFALRLAAICRQNGWDDAPYLEEALDTLEAVPVTRRHDLFILAEAHARQVARNRTPAA